MSSEGRREPPPDILFTLGNDTKTNLAIEFADNRDRYLEWCAYTFRYGKSVRTGIDPPLPLPARPNDVQPAGLSAAQKTAWQTAFKEETKQYELEKQRVLTERKLYEDQKQYMFAALLSRCEPALKNDIKNELSFAAMDEANNTRALLLMIEEKMSMQWLMETNPHQRVQQVLERFTSAKQMDDETLDVYTRRYKVVWEENARHGINLIRESDTVTMRLRYPNEPEEAIAIRTKAQVMTNTYLGMINQKRYRHIVNGWMNMNGAAVSAWPDTIEKANIALKKEELRLMQQGDAARQQVAFHTAGSQQTTEATSLPSKGRYEQHPTATNRERPSTPPRGHHTREDHRPTTRSQSRDSTPDRSRDRSRSRSRDRDRPQKRRHSPDERDRRDTRRQERRSHDRGGDTGRGRGGRGRGSGRGRGGGGGRWKSLQLSPTTQQNIAEIVAQTIITHGNTLTNTNKKYLLCLNAHDELTKNQNLIIQNDEVLLDNQSTVNIFNNKSLLQDIQPLAEHVTITGVGGAQMHCKLAGVHPVFGQVLYHPNSVANIISFAALREKHAITYNPERNQFIVQYAPTHRMVFKCIDRLYRHKALPIWNIHKLLGTTDNIALVQTVDNIKQMYTTREVKAAELARQLFRRLGRPSSKEFRKMIRKGTLLNCPVTIQDVERADQIYGKELGTLKGRTTRQRPKHIHVPKRHMTRKNPKIVLAMDIVTIEGVSFLATVSRRLKLITTVRLQSHEGPEVIGAIKSIINDYTRHGYQIDTILCDGEKAFVKADAEVAILQVKMNITAKAEHVGEIERENRTIKERARAIINMLPYKLNAQMIEQLIYYVVMCINMFPRNNQSQSPREEYTARKLDFKVDCQLEFGEYVQVSEDEEITNTMASRTTGAICMGPAGTLQGTYKFLSLTTWRILRRRSWTSLPVPQEVVKVINDKVKEEVNATHARTQRGIRAHVQRLDRQIVQNQHNLPPGLPMMPPTNALMPTPAAPPGLPPPQAARVRRPRAPRQPRTTPVVNPVSTALSIVPATASRQPTDQQIKTSISTHLHALSLATHTIKQGVAKFGKKAEAALEAEMRQMHEKKVFEVVDYAKLSYKQRKKVLRTICFLQDKSDGRIKARFCADGRLQVIYGTEIDPASPTVKTDSVMITTAIDAFQKRHVTIVDIEGAYLAVDMTEEVYIIINKQLSDILARISPIYANAPRHNGQLCMRLKKALYGCVQSARLFYDHLSATMEKDGFRPNPYDVCIFNRGTGDRQCTATVHVDDIKISSQQKAYNNHVVKHLTKLTKLTK